MDRTENPIIIKRARKRQQGQHGGSWKIAFADFALAMMAFFLVLWLIESTTELEKRAIAGYFSDPTSLSTHGDGGTPYLLDLGGQPSVIDEGFNVAMMQEEQNEQDLANVDDDTLMELARARQTEVFEDLKEQVEELIAANQEFEWFTDSVTIEVTEDGLSIQIVDRLNRPIFDLGSSRMRPYALEILWAIADILCQVPNLVSIYGHTDSLPYADNDGSYTNWELSADRANAARRALAEGGLPYEQFAQIIGMGSSMPLDEDDPTHHINRRIVIMVLNRHAEERMRDTVRQSELSGGGLPDSAQPVTAPPEIF